MRLLLLLRHDFCDGWQTATRIQAVRCARDGSDEVNICTNYLRNGSGQRIQRGVRGTRCYGQRYDGGRLLSSLRSNDLLNRRKTEDYLITRPVLLIDLIGTYNLMAVANVDAWLIQINDLCNLMRRLLLLLVMTVSD